MVSVVSMVISEGAPVLRAAGGSAELVYQAPEENVDVECVDIVFERRRLQQQQAAALNRVCLTP